MRATATRGQTTSVRRAGGTAERTCHARADHGWLDARCRNSSTASPPAHPTAGRVASHRCIAAASATSASLAMLADQARIPQSVLVKTCIFPGKKEKMVRCGTFTLRAHTSGRAWTNGTMAARMVNMVKRKEADKRHSIFEMRRDLETFSVQVRGRGQLRVGTPRAGAIGRAQRRRGAGWC